MKCDRYRVTRHMIHNILLGSSNKFLLPSSLDTPFPPPPKKKYVHKEEPIKAAAIIWQLHLW